MVFTEAKTTDICEKNSRPLCALRFRIWLKGQVEAYEIVGIWLIHPLLWAYLHIFTKLMCFQDIHIYEIYIAFHHCYSDWDFDMDIMPGTKFIQK